MSVETGALENLTLRSRVFARIDASWSLPPYSPTWGGLTSEIVSKRAAAVADGFKQNLTVYSPILERRSWQSRGADMNQAIIEKFIATIREGRHPCVIGVEALRAA